MWKCLGQKGYLLDEAFPWCLSCLQTILAVFQVPSLVWTRLSREVRQAVLPEIICSSR